MKIYAIQNLEPGEYAIQFDENGRNKNLALTNKEVMLFQIILGGVRERLDNQSKAHPAWGDSSLN